MSKNAALKLALEALEICAVRQEHQWDGMQKVSIAKAAIKDALKPWKKLTKEEKSLFSSWLDEKTDAQVFEAIEAKLKEKNA